MTYATLTDDDADPRDRLTAINKLILQHRIQKHREAVHEENIRSTRNSINTEQRVLEDTGTSTSGTDR